MHTVKSLEAESIIPGHMYRYCKEKIDQTQLQWYIGQFLHTPAGPGRFLGLTNILERVFLRRVNSLIRHCIYIGPV